MRRFVAEHVQPLPRPLRVLDVGARSVNGDYRGLFAGEGVTYLGLDVEPGPNVDIVVGSPYRWDEVPAGSFEVVVSGQALEHIEFPWVTICEMERVMAAGGLLCVIVPSRGPEHRHPLDCWRCYPDGLRALAAWAGLEVLSCALGESAHGDDESAIWGDAVLIARKPARAPLQRVRASVVGAALRRMSTRRAGLRRAAGV